MSADRDARHLAGLGELATVAFARIEFGERRWLGLSITAARQLARLSRGDLARALRCDEQAIADLESGSLVLERGR